MSKDVVIGASEHLPEFGVPLFLLLSQPERIFLFTLTLIHTGVASIALLNFEEILLKKCGSKVCLEKLCKAQVLH
jgi:hypothetical protein